MSCLRHVYHFIHFSLLKVQFTLYDSFRYRDIDKKDNLGLDPDVDTIITFVTNDFVFGINAEAVEAKWVVFQNTFSAKATNYMSQWMSKRSILLLCLSLIYNIYILFV